MEIWQNKYGKSSKDREEYMGGEANGKIYQIRNIDTVDRNLYFK